MINLPIGQILLGNGLISKEQLESALAHQKKMKGVRLGDILLHLKYIDEIQYLKALSERIDAPFCSDLVKTVDEHLSQLIPIDIARKYEVMPISSENGQITVLMNDPLDFYTLDDLHIITGYHIKPMLSTRDIIIRSIDLSYHNVTKSLKRKTTNSDELGFILGEILYVLQNKGYHNVDARQTDNRIDIKITL